MLQIAFLKINISHLLVTNNIMNEQNPLVLLTAFISETGPRNMLIITF